MDDKEKFFDAIKAGDASRVKEMVGRDASLAGARDAKGLSAVMTARYYSKLDALRELLAAQPELNIFEAAAVGDTARVSELLARDASLANAVSGDGGTALHFAAFFGAADAAGVLIRNGAGVDTLAAGFGNVTPLHSAAAGRETRIVEALLKAGADPNLKQNGGFTPLHSTAMQGNVANTRLLLEHGADPSLKDDTGKTALRMAEEKGHHEVVKLIRKRK